jgi:hypothetical protein
MMQRVMTLSFNALPSISPPLQKYDLLMCSAPAVDFDCSDLHDARYLLNAVAHAAAHSGCILPTHTLRMMFCLFFACSHTIFSCRLRQKHQHEPQLVDINRRSGASATPATLFRPSAREHVKQPPPWHCRCYSDRFIACWCVAWASACARLSLEKRVVIAFAGDIKGIDMTDCGLTLASAELQQQLQRLSTLRHANMSGNPLLGTTGVTAIVSSFAGA